MTIQKCPINSDFTFLETCAVSCCMYHSSVIDHNCIVLGRKESNEGGISDEEVAYLKKIPAYKFERFKIETLEKIQKLVALRKFVDFCSQFPTIETDARFNVLLRHWPFNLPEMEINSHNIIHLLSSREWKTFKHTYNYEGLKAMRHNHILFLKKPRLQIWQTLAKSIKVASVPNL